MLHFSSLGHVFDIHVFGTILLTFYTTVYVFILFDTCFKCFSFLDHLPLFSPPVIRIIDNIIKVATMHL